jgi:hypothetical protein
MLRAFFWGGFLPVSIGVATLLNPAALLAASAYFLQILRIALKERSTSRRPWLRALFLTLASLAEIQGVLVFLLRKRQQGAAALIEYK